MRWTLFIASTREMKMTWTPQKCSWEVRTYMASCVCIVCVCMHTLRVSRWCVYVHSICTCTAYTRTLFQRMSVLYLGESVYLSIYLSIYLSTNFPLSLVHYLDHNQNYNPSPRNSCIADFGSSHSKSRNRMVPL